MPSNLINRTIWVLELRGDDWGGILTVNVQLDGVFNRGGGDVRVLRPTRHLLADVVDVSRQRQFAGRRVSVNGHMLFGVFQSSGAHPPGDGRRRSRTRRNACYRRHFIRRQWLPFVDNFNR